MMSIDTSDVCCASLELSQSKWICAFASAGNEKASLHNFAAGDSTGLVAWLARLRSRAEGLLGRPLRIVLCYEAGYDGFWLARLLPTHGIDVVVFDPSSFLTPRRGRVAKTDRLDAEGMVRTLRVWLGGDRTVARDVRIPSVEEEDAKRILRERKNLVIERTRIIGRIKGLCALHGLKVGGKMIGKRWAKLLGDQLTGDGRPLPPFLRREIERLLRRYVFIGEMIADVDRDAAMAVSEAESSFPHRDKVRRLERLGGIGLISATLLVAEVFHRQFESRRHLASFLGLAPSPHASGETSRDRGISKAGAKLARQTMVELAWSWLRYQPDSALSVWWRARFGGQGMRGRKVGIVALARRLVIALWRFVEEGVVPEGARLKD
jgi:transposase